MCADKSFIEKYISSNDFNMMLENRPLQLCAQDGRLEMYLHDDIGNVWTTQRL